MKKRLLSFVLVLLIPGLLLCGCGTKNKDYKVYDETRFVFVGEYNKIEDLGGNTVNLYLLVDKETRIIYLYAAGHVSGLTPLLDKDGNVTYYTGSLKE